MRRRSNHGDGEEVRRATEQMSYKDELYIMKAMGRRRWAMLGMLVLGGAGMAGACAPSKPGPLDPGTLQPAKPAECMMPIEEPCKRYKIPLLGNPTTDVALRNKYIAAFGTVCYMSVANAFNCFYRKENLEKACADAKMIADVYGAAPYAKTYKCMPVDNGDYSLQVGSDEASKIFITYETAPPQTPLTEVDGVQTAVNGPYRDLPNPDPQEVGPGKSFWCAKIDGVWQRDRILKMNRDAPAHMGKIYSDLPGYKYPCPEKAPMLCEEPEILNTKKYDPDSAEVHHVVPRKNGPLCPWGTNANANAAVISSRLNKFLRNKNPPADEVKKINAIPPYVP